MGRDLEYVHLETPHVVGLPTTAGGSGDTSVMTGLGIYMGMKACARQAWGSDSLAGKKIAIQGFGKVAFHLVHHLLKEDAQLVVTDVYSESARPNDCLARLRFPRPRAKRYLRVLDRSKPQAPMCFGGRSSPRHVWYRPIRGRNEATASLGDAVRGDAASAVRPGSRQPLRATVSGIPGSLVRFHTPAD